MPMFVYALRIFDRFRQPAVRLAILCDGKADWRPHHYEFHQAGTHLSFQCEVVKLLDYQSRWAELVADPNPFATIVMAQLKAQETRRQATARKEWKLSLIRHLYEAGYSRRDVLYRFKFIDWVLILPEALKQLFWSELKAYEKDRQVPYITSVEEIGFERGLQQGRQEACRSLILYSYDKKLGDPQPSSRSHF